MVPEHALRNGAWALRYCADRLQSLTGPDSPIEVRRRVEEYREQARKLDAWAASHEEAQDDAA